ncbi:MAG: hypothetical protein NC489_45615 [Ruminococcus flavefaciens]|nr:hypothetical protein [Ruminococcus flavefaciens]
MKKTFEFKLKNGSTCRLEAKYECVMKREEIYYCLFSEPKPTTAGRCDMAAYIDGKKVDSCQDPAFWRLIDVKGMDGVKAIWGLPVGFSDPKIAKKYEKFVADLMEEGTSEEAKAYKKAEKAKEEKEELEGAREIIRRAEAQKTIPTEEEKRKYIKEYKNAMNEGSEGYIPNIISITQYNRAKEFVKNTSRSK